MVSLALHSGNSEITPVNLSGPNAILDAGELNLVFHMQGKYHTGCTMTLVPSFDFSKVLKVSSPFFFMTFICISHFVCNVLFLTSCLSCQSLKSKCHFSKSLYNTTIYMRPYSTNTHTLCYKYVYVILFKLY